MSRAHTAQRRALACPPPQDPRDLRVKEELAAREGYKPPEAQVCELPCFAKNTIVASAKLTHVMQPSRTALCAWHDARHERRLHVLCAPRRLLRRSRMRGAPARER